MAALEPGSKAPDFSLPDRNGDVQSLRAALEKGPVLLTFFKISCPTCQYALPFFDRLSAATEASPVTFWAVSQNDRGSTAAFNREFEVEPPELFDSEDEDFPASNAYGVTHVPTSFLIEQDGAISLSSVGWDKAEFEQISQQLAAAASVPDLTVFNPGEDVLDYKAG